MPSLRSLSLLALSALLSSITPSVAKIKSEVAPKVPGAYIVELQDNQVRPSLLHELHHAKILTLIRAKTRSTTVSVLLVKLLNVAKT